MAKATHYGHCQACGHQQKLPKGLLSKHGYRVRFGFFMGVCRGAKHPPYEESCELVKRMVVEAQKDLVRVEAYIEKLNTPATEAKGWIHVYVPSKGRERSYYEWRECVIEAREVPFSDGKGSYWIYNRQRAIGEDEKDLHRAREVKVGYEIESTGDVLQVCTELNRKYAKWMANEPRTLKMYIKWQQERVTAWKLAPLQPVEEVDEDDLDEGFKPEEPAY